MDPNVTLLQALTAMVDGNRQDAQDRLDELAAWLSRGGFLPDVPRIINRIREEALNG